MSEKGIEKAIKYAEWDKIELEADGKLKGASDHIKAVKEEWAEYVTTTTTTGAKTSNPPANNGTGTGKNLEIAMRGSRAEIDGIELDGDKIKDASTLDALVKGDFSGLVATTTTKGANTVNPPANNGTGTGKTREEILAIKDGSVRRAEMAKNPHLFGLTDN